MTNPEHSAESSDDINHRFESIMDNLAIHTDESYYYMPLNEEKEIIIQAALDQILPLEDQLNSDDPDVIGAALIKANMRLDTQLRTMDNICRNEEICASGQTIIMINYKDDPTGRTDIMPLSDRSRVRGTLNNAVISTVPPITDVSRLLNDVAGDETSEDYYTNGFIGVALSLRDAIFEEDGCEDQSVPDNISVYVPLNYPGLALHRVIRAQSE